MIIEYFNLSSWEFIVFLVVFAVIALPIIASRGFKGVAVLLSAMVASGLVLQRYHQVMYANLTFFCILLICMMVVPAE